MYVKLDQLILIKDEFRCMRHHYFIAIYIYYTNSVRFIIIFATINYVDASVKILNLTLQTMKV